MFLSLGEPKRAQDAGVIALHSLTLRGGFKRAFCFLRTNKKNQRTMSSTDVESLQPASRQRSRCLDVFLLVSVVTLFVMVLSGGALAFYTIRALRGEVDHVTRPPADIEKVLHQQGPPELHSPYKMQHFAYLTPLSSSLKNGSMEWVPSQYKTSNTIGSSYRYDSGHHALTMIQEGIYFLYTHLNLSCVGNCQSGSLGITFSDNTGEELLSCSLHLTHPGPLVKNCWTVIPRFLKGRRLMARMHTSVPPDGWSLDLNYSGFGMFLVDGPGKEKEKKMQ